MFALYKSILIKNEVSDPVSFFKNPFDSYEEEINRLGELEDKTKFCALFMLVVNNGYINVSRLADETKEQRKKRQRLFEKCGVPFSTPPGRIIEQFESLINLFVKKGLNNANSTIFTTIHDKAFDFLCFYFGKHLQANFIEFSGCRVLYERARLMSVPGEKGEFTVVIKKENEDDYLRRIIRDICEGNTVAVFHSAQMACKEFRLKFISHLQNRKEKTLKQRIYSDSSFDDYNFQNKLKLPWPSLNLCFKLKYFDIASVLLQSLDEINSDKFLILLNMAVSSGEINMVKLLLDKRTSPAVIEDDKYRDYLPHENPLILACRKNNTEIIQLLVERGADVNAVDMFGNTPLNEACKVKNIEIFKLLIERGADINPVDCHVKTPLMVACEVNNTEIFKLLIERGADIYPVDFLVKTPLMVACEKNNTEIFKLLVEMGADINAVDWSGNTPLILACSENSTEIAKLLIERGADFNAVDRSGNTPLIMACERNKSEVIKLLVERGADVNATVRCRKTPLILACSENNMEIIKLLVEKGANVNAADKYRCTPLIWACKNNNADIIKLLVERGADVNDVNAFQGSWAHSWLCDDFTVSSSKLNNMTSLMHACKLGSYDIVELLINKKADVFAKDDSGKTPLIYATESGNDETVKLINDHISCCQNKSESNFGSNGQKRKQDKDIFDELKTKKKKQSI